MYWTRTNHLEVRSAEPLNSTRAAAMATEGQSAAAAAQQEQWQRQDRHSSSSSSSSSCSGSGSGSSGGGSGRGGEIRKTRDMLSLKHSAGKCINDLDEGGNLRAWELLETR